MATDGVALGDTPPAVKPRDRTHYLYIAVIAATLLGVLVGVVDPELGVKLKPLGDGFVSLVKMMITPIIFCTIVLGIGSIRKATSVGKVGGLALGYFLVMSTFALAIGLVVGNLVHAGSDLHLTAEAAKAGAGQAGPASSASDFLLEIIPTTFVSAFTSGQILQVLFIALLCGFAVQRIGAAGEAVVRGVGSIQKLVFRVLAMLMWVAPIGAFGAMAAVVGKTGWKAVGALTQVMLGFYLTCAIFVFAILGTVLWMVARVSVLRLFRYLAREFLLILSTSSSETALPRLIAKMEHLGISRPVVGIVVPTGYSFNLDGTAIYLTMTSLFIADALGKPLSVSEQISLLLFMIIASKGAAGVTGAGLATLAGGLQAHRPDLVGGVGFVIGIDRFMSEARALTNFAGNAIATVVIGTWTQSIDTEQVERVLSGQLPFDEAKFVDDHSSADPHPAEDPTDDRSDGPGHTASSADGIRPLAASTSGDAGTGASAGATAVTPRR